MPDKKKRPGKPAADPKVEGLRPEVRDVSITATLEQNYMPYAMSVIVSRAIPEIDGFKPSHRKLLYTMYKMGLLTGARTKSANVVGQTMRLNPHGESAIYDTLVRLSRGYEALLHPLVDSKGNFGKVYSRDMACAASRYTEVKLAGIAAELFRDIDSDTVDFADNYDSTMKEPTLLPGCFPQILVSANQGIAVGMASQLCGFNLREVCHTTIAYLKNPDCDLLETLPAPDFPTGGELLYDVDVCRAIYETGRGSFRLRARWRYDKKNHVIEIIEIPYTTTGEAILDKVSELIKAGKIKEISDMRDETDKEGFTLAIELKRGADPDKLMQRLFKQTPLSDTFSCNFNILIAGSPQVLGVRRVLEEWCAWRTECVRRKLSFESGKLYDRLHLLEGLGKILLDIDRAIRIIRETDEESEVVPNLMIGFGIDKIQAEFVAELRLRHINREYILKRTAETDELRARIAEIDATLSDRKKLRDILIHDLKRVADAYGQDRKTTLVYQHETRHEDMDEPIEDYPVHCFLSREGYFKKITPASLRMSGEQKYKEADGPAFTFEARNAGEILFFTSRQQCYKARLHEFDDSKASAMGDFLPAKLDMDADERVVWMCLPGDYTGSILFVFENGKAARVELSAYATKSNRRRLTGAYSDKSPLMAAFLLAEEREICLTTNDGRALIFHTGALVPKTTRGTQGVAVLTLKGRRAVTAASFWEDSGLSNPARYRVRNLPAAGAPLRAEDQGEQQLTLT